MKHLLYLSFLFGCSGTEKNTEPEMVEPAPESPEEPEDPQDASEAPGANSNGVGEADLSPVTNRDARRLSIRALSASLTQITGVEWLEDGESPYYTYRSTLGIPNYSQSVSEDLDPGIMFYKQLMNAANHSCEVMVNRDLELPLSDRKLLSNISEDSNDPDEVKTALVKALVRFHGEEEDLAHDSATLTKWYDLWQGVHDAHGSDEIESSEGSESSEEADDVNEQNANLMAWQLVCEALILSPNFYTY